MRFSVSCRIEEYNVYALSMPPWVRPDPRSDSAAGDTSPIIIILLLRSVVEIKNPKPKKRQTRRRFTDRSPRTPLIARQQCTYSVNLPMAANPSEKLRMVREISFSKPITLRLLKSR